MVIVMSRKESSRLLITDLYHYFPDNPRQTYDLRQRPHKVLMSKTSFLCDRDFIIRTLYKNTLINNQFTCSIACFICFYFFKF